MIPVVLYWSVNTEHLYSTNSYTNSQYPLGDISVSLFATSWHFFHVLDPPYGGTSAAHVGHAIPSAGMGCTGMAGWERHTPCCWGGQVEVRPCKQWESWGISESPVVQRGAGHKSIGNQGILLVLLFMELYVSLTSASNLELLSLRWLRYSNQGRQPEFTCTMTLKCTYLDLHNTGVWI